MAYNKFVTEEGDVLLDLSTDNVAESDVTEGKMFHLPSGEVGIGSGSGGAAIIDVTELPTENIREDVFYRLLTGSFVANQYTQNNMICHCVDVLSATGEPALSGDLSALENATITAYYNTQDESVSAYVTDVLSGVFGVPAGWYPIAVLMGAVGFTFGGVITDIMDDPSDDSFRLLLEYVIWQYKDGWTSMKSIGKAGTGASAEVFNHPSNEASGLCSHAEGDRTTASGAYSHAEGDSTTANGQASHAEGWFTTANGHASHTEGSGTTASGYYSHAEGGDTTATRRSQHVQGEYNILDTEGADETVRGKYAHIVGNGSYNNPSNAHTLDWDGNAWFAGGIELTSPNGTRYRFTVDNDGNLTATAVDI